MNSDGDDNLDEIKMKQIKNFDFDENIFANNDNNNSPVKKNVKEIKKGKGKKHKGIDFMEYAKNNGISINIQYEDTSVTNTTKKMNKKEYNNMNVNSNKHKHKKENNEHVNNNNNMNNNDKCVKGKEQQKENNINKDEVNNNDYFNINSYFNGIDEQDVPNYNMDININANYINDITNINNNNNYDIQQQDDINDDQEINNYNHQMLLYNNNLNNKRSINFNYNNDNTYNNNIPPYQNQFQPYILEQNTSQQQEHNIYNNQYIYQQPQQPPLSFPSPPPPIQYPQNNPQQFYQYQQVPYNQSIPPIQNNQYIMEILSTVESIFSLKNLNLDINLRLSLNENGWIESNTLISSYSKLSAMNVTSNLLLQIMKSIDSNIVECFYDMSNCSLYLRNKHYDFIQNNLLSVDAMKIQNKKRMENNQQHNGSFYYNNMLMQMGQNVTQIMMNHNNGKEVYY